MDSQTDIESDAAARDRYIVPALAQGLAALSLFSRQRPTLTAPEVAQALGLSRSTVFRLLHTLAALGYVVRGEERQYRLGPALLNRGFAYLASLDLVEVAQKQLEALRDETGNATQLAVLEGTEILYLARCLAPRPLTSNVAVGTRLPAHATAMGRVLLMEIAPDAVHALFAGRRMVRFTDITPTTVPRLLELLAEDRARGHVLSRSNFEAGVDMLALPVRDAQGRIVAAISLVGHDWPGDPAWFANLLAAGERAARRISAWLGHAGTEFGEGVE